MKREEILKLCHFYKGEEQPPKEFNRLPEGKLWVAEQFACEYPEMFDGYDNPEKRMAEIVCSYVSKWDVYTRAETLKVYFQKSPTYESELYDIYCM